MLGGFFFQKHEGTNLSDKVLYSRAATGKSYYSLPFMNVKGRKTLDVSLHPLGSCLLAQQSEKSVPVSVDR